MRRCDGCHKMIPISKGLLFEWVGLRCGDADHRVQACRGCDRATWLTRVEYINWLALHGFTAWRPWRWPAFLAAVEAMEPLPIRPEGPKKRMYCSLCKCPIRRKAALAESTCPLGRWEK